MIFVSTVGQTVPMARTVHAVQTVPYSKVLPGKLRPDVLDRACCVYEPCLPMAAAQRLDAKT
eukprot:1324121-Amphidinium_carterae.1